MEDHGFVVRWRGAGGILHKYRFEPTSTGYRRIEYEQIGTQWREVGWEPVEAVAIEMSGEIEGDDS
jgi:hypothetical protein